MATEAYRLSPLARDDLAGIWFYTSEHWSVAQADRYHRSLVAMFEALASGRKRGRVAEARRGYQKCPCGAHVIYFRDLGDRLEIVRVLHGRQDTDRYLSD